MTGKRKTVRKAKTEEEVKPLMVSEASEAFASSSSTTTTPSRRNLSGTITRTDRYKNISDGLIPYKFTPGTGASNRSNIDVRDAVILCQKAYYNFAAFRNVIDLMTEFSISNLYFKGSTKKSRDFFSAFFRKLNILGFQDRFFREYFRSGNVFVYRFDGKVQPEDMSKITQMYGASFAAEEKLPARYMILNPADIQLTGSAAFWNGNYYKVFSDYELSRLQNPQTDEDREILDSLDPDSRKMLQTNKRSKIVLMKLDPNKVKPVFYKKQDYEPFAVPLGFPVLEDINYKAELKKMDMAIARTMQQAILLVTMGTDPEKGGVNQKNLEAMQTLFQNQSVGRVLIADYTTKAEFVIPNIGSLLDGKKYEVVDRDIQLGLNNILVGESTFANQNAKIDLFIARLEQARSTFMEDFLIPEIKRISKAMGFKSYPTPYFDRITLRDDTNMLRIYNRLIELGILTAEEGLEAIDTGRLPDKEMSLKSQEEFKELRDQGLYEPLIGGKNQSEIKKEPGRPEGAPAPTPEQNPAGQGEQSNAVNYSLTMVTDNLTKASKLFKTVEASLRKKHKIKRLNKQQKQVAEEIACIIVANETPENWDKKVSQYVQKPVDTNPDRIAEVREVAFEHQVDDYLASILLASKA
jgi:hypothetical protein